MKVARLGEVAELVSGGTPSRTNADYFGEGTPWVSITDLNDSYVKQTKESLTPAGLTNSAAKVIPDGTVLVAMYGASIGKLGIAGRSLSTNQAIAAVQPDHKRLNRQYLFHYLLSQREQLRSRGRGGAQPNISLGDLKNWPIPLPDLAEQRRIADILDQADDLRLARNQVLGHLETLASSLFIEVFGSQRYETVELSEAVRPGTIVTYGIVQAGPEYDGGVPYVRTGDIVDGAIRTRGLRHTDPAIASKFERSRVSVGDIVMSIRATVGTTALVPPELDGANLTQGTAKISPSDVATGPFLLHYLRSPGAQRWIQAKVKGATFREITLGALRQLPIPLAPVELQEKFNRHLKMLTTARLQAIASSDHLDELFNSLQSQAFTGQL